MNIKKLFSLDWLFSETRKEIKHLIDEVKKQTEKPLVSQYVVGIDPYKVEKPYKNLYFSGSNVTVVLNEGEVLTSECDLEKYVKIKEATTKNEIFNLLYPKKQVEEIVIEKNDLAILEVNDDFEVRGTEVFLKPCKLALPEVVKASFIEILEKKLALNTSFKQGSDFDIDNFDIDNLDKQYESLKMFWYKLSTNSVEKCRQSVLRFCKDNDVRISKTGNLITYRRVVKYNGSKSDVKLENFINKEYKRITKVWKKKASDYNVYDDNGYVLVKSDRQNHGYNRFVGNLADLKSELCKQEDLYTSWHNSGKYIFKIGDVYKLEDGEQPDDSLDNCSSNGLHGAAVNWNYSGFGDTAVVCLVNPAKTIFVPTIDTGKFRCSEMKIACINPNQQGVHIDEALIEEADNEYNDYTIKELEQVVETKDFSSLSVQKNLPLLSLPELQDIVKTLQNKVVNI